MANQIAKLISVLFHPLLMPLFGVLIFFNLPGYHNFTYPDTYKLSVYGLIFVNTVLIPGSFIGVLYQRKIISSLSLENQKERTLPLLLTAGFYTFTYLLFKSAHLPAGAHAMLLAAAASVSVLLIANVFIKLSAHMVGIGGLLVAFVALGLKHQYQVVFTVFVFSIIAGLIASSRLKLNAHTPTQVYLGFLLGGIIQGLVIWFNWG